MRGDSLRTACVCRIAIESLGLLSRAFSRNASMIDTPVSEYIVQYAATRLTRAGCWILGSKGTMPTRALRLYDKLDLKVTIRIKSDKYYSSDHDNIPCLQHHLPVSASRTPLRSDRCSRGSACRCAIPGRQSLEGDDVQTKAAPVPLTLLRTHCELRVTYIRSTYISGD